MALSSEDLERLRAALAKGDPLPSGEGLGEESALVSGGGSDGEAQARETVYDRLRRARPVQPHRFDPQPWRPPGPGAPALSDPAGAEAEHAEGPNAPLGPVDYAARAASASLLHDLEDARPAPPEEATVEPAPPPVPPSTEQLLRARDLAKAAREGTRGPPRLGATGPRTGPYKQLV